MVEIIFNPDESNKELPKYPEKIKKFGLSLRFCCLKYLDRLQQICYPFSCSKDTLHMPFVGKHARHRVRACFSTAHPYIALYTHKYCIYSTLCYTIKCLSHGTLNATIHIIFAPQQVSCMNTNAPMLN